MMPALQMQLSLAKQGQIYDTVNLQPTHFEV
jgi:hypothetical protein